MDTIYWARTLQEALSKAIDSALIEVVERIEGRVPSNDEISRYMLHVIQIGQPEIYKWRGVPVVSVTPKTFPEVGFTVTTLV